MLGGSYLGQIPLGGFADWVPSDLTIDVTATATKISPVSGKNTATFTFTTTEAFAAYEIRAVPSTTSPHTAGTLIESGGGGSAGSPISVDVTAAELSSAGLGEGDYTIKVFVLDAGGNWSV